MTNKFTNAISSKKEELNRLELENQKVEILDCDALFGGSTDLVDLLKFILNLIKV